MAMPCKFGSFYLCMSSRVNDRLAIVGSISAATALSPEYRSATICMVARWIDGVCACDLSQCLPSSTRYQKETRITASKVVAESLNQVG